MTALERIEEIKMYGAYPPGTPAARANRDQQFLLRAIEVYREIAIANKRYFDKKIDEDGTARIMFGPTDDQEKETDEEFEKRMARWPER